MTKQISGYVTVDGTTYPPGEVPAAVARQITNPKVWGDVDVVAPGPDAGGDAGDGKPAEPPRAGAGSGTAAWVAYATSLGIEVPEDAQRDAIVELVDQHNSDNS